MKVTSNFIGVRLNSELFSDLFNSLQKFFEKNEIENAIEFQNWSSLHIALFYFGKDLDILTLAKIKDDLSELNKKENIFPVYIDRFSTFERGEKKFLGYLYPSESQNLEMINSNFKQHYISEVPDNDYAEYIPHVSLFRIRDEDQYQKYGSEITLIMEEHLEKIGKSDTFISFNLYSVDSNVSPEIQTVIL